MSAEIKPFINIGPGQILKREMEYLNWSNEDLAEIIGMTPKSISQLINNKQSITVETAVLLGKAFDVSPEFWLNLDSSYRLRLREENKKEIETENRAKIRKYMPVSDMKKKGWIVSDKSAESELKAYCSFWGQKNPDYSVYENKLPYCARQKNTDEKYTEYYTRTWLHKAKTESDKTECTKYDPELLKKAAEKINEFSLKKNGVELFIKELNSAGVKFMILRHLEKTYLDGACFIRFENPVIVYTGRYNRVDNFWWTIAHEIGHILLHLKDNDDCYLDDFDDKEIKSKREEEADLFANDLLRVNELLKLAENYRNYFPEQKFVEISEKHGIDPAVSVGILQYNEYLSYRSLNKYKKSILDLIPEQYFRG